MVEIFPGGFNVKNLHSNVPGITGRQFTEGAAGNLISAGAAIVRNRVPPIVTGSREAVTALGAHLVDTGFGPRGNTDLFPIISRALDRNTAADPQIDRRIRIKAKNTTIAAQQVYGPQSGNNILSIFHTTNGVIFPYTPTINLRFTADWAPVQVTHSNYQTQAYTRSAIDNITIIGQFTAQNEQEAFYSFAATHFFKTMTKMHYGRNDTLAGATPPVLSLVGYGNGVFNDIPVVITGFSQEYGDQVDMVKTTFNGGAGTAWVPTLTTLIVELAVSHDLKRVRDEFNLDAFRTGALLTGNKGF